MAKTVKTSAKFRPVPTAIAEGHTDKPTADPQNQPRVQLAIWEGRLGVAMNKMRDITEFKEYLQAAEQVGGWRNMILKEEEAAAAKLIKPEPGDAQ